MLVVIALVVIALMVGIGGLIKGLFWLLSIGVILLLVGLALGVSKLRSSSR